MTSLRPRQSKGIAAPNFNTSAAGSLSPQQATSMQDQFDFSAPYDYTIGPGIKSPRYDKAKISDLAYETMVNNMLFQPHTPFINFTSGAFTALTVPIDNTFRFITSRFNEPKYRTSAQEVLASAYGQVHGVLTALKYTGERLKHSVSRSGETPEETLQKLNMPAGLHMTNRIETQRRAFKSTTLGLDENSILGHIADGIGSIINIPGSTLNSMDMMFKLMHAESKLYGNAVRQVISGQAPDLMTARQTILMDPAQQKQLVDTAEYYTFMNRASMPTLSWVTDAEFEKLPGLRFIIPFKRSIAAILEQTIERSPLVFFSPTLAKRLGPGAAPEVRAEAQAKLLTGMSLTTALGFALQDNLNGKAPRDQIDRQLWENVNGPEDTLIFKDTEVFGTVALELDTMGVYGQHLKMLARYIQWNSNLKDEEMIYKGEDPDAQRQMLKEFGAIVSPMVEVLYDSYWGRNVVEFSHVVMKAIEHNDPSSLFGWLERMGVKMIPVVGTGAMKKFAQMDDPHLHKYDKIGDYFKQHLDTTSEMVGYVYAWNGKKYKAKQFRGVGSEQLMRYPYAPEDPIEKKLVELGVHVPATSRIVNAPGLSENIPGVRVKMNDQEWDEYNTLHDTGVPEYNIPSITDVITTVIESEKLDVLPPVEQRMRLESIFTEYRGIVRAYMTRPGTALFNRLMKAQEEKIDLIQKHREKWLTNHH